MIEMNLAEFTRANRPNRKQMIEISDYLIKELESTLELRLSCFRRSIVEGESFVASTHGVLNASDIFALNVEAMVLWQTRTDQPPSINAEVLLFSRGERIGLQQNNGRSYLLFDFDCTRKPSLWKAQGWFNDGPEDWEHISSLRANLYEEYQETWEDNA